MVLHSGLKTNHLYLGNRTQSEDGGKWNWKPSNRINTSPLGSWVSEQGIVRAVQVPHLPHLARDVVLDVRVHPALEERSRHSVLFPQAILEGVLTVQRVRLNFISNSRSDFVFPTWHMPRMKYSTTASSNWQIVHKLSTELIEQIASPHFPLFPTPVCQENKFKRHQNHDYWRLSLLWRGRHSCRLDWHPSSWCNPLSYRFHCHLAKQDQSQSGMTKIAT